MIKYLMIYNNMIKYLIRKFSKSIVHIILSLNRDLISIITT